MDDDILRTVDHACLRFDEAIRRRRSVGVFPHIPGDGVHPFVPISSLLRMLSDVLGEIESVLASIPGV
jgi:hypothetical protein